MHFWIDKRSQGYGFDGRHRLPASLTAGRRKRNKPVITSVHRFQPAGNGNHYYLHCQNHSNLQATPSTQQMCLMSAISNVTINGSVLTEASQSEEIEENIFAEPTAEVSVDAGQHSQLVRLGGLIKFGICASVGLVTVSVAATKFFINHQSTFEMLLLCTLGMLSIGLFCSCILSACRTKSAHELIMAPPQSRRTEMEIHEVISQRGEPIMTVDAPRRASHMDFGLIPEPESEQPPPPYHIAVLLPPKKGVCKDAPPPSYENAMR